ncbi:glycosyltransferase [Enterococcus sp. AZ072]|uniref:glycosyltransferase n=1 Tax=unclassified Enterococcus TaxID=2608891 RepID=UPI003D2AC23A
MKLSDIRIMHITNNFEIGGVQKIIYQLCNITKKHFSEIITVSSGGVYVDRINKLGIEHVTIPDLSTKNIKEILSIIQILKKTIKKNDINVIHCHHRMGVLFAKLASPHTRIVYNNHTIYSDKPKLTHAILRNVEIIADGEQAAKNVAEYFGISEFNITTINNSVEEYQEEYVEIEEISRERKKNKFIVMNSARLHPQKGINYFIEAACILVKRGYDISFFMVGDGPLMEEMKRLVEQKSLKKHFFFLGFRNDIKNTISQCDLLVLTSIYEGLPLTPMEAFSVKKAVIATDIPGNREVVENNVSGLLAETKNPISIAEKIECLYKDRKLLNDLNINSYKQYHEKFSMKVFKQSYLDFYSDL